MKSELLTKLHSYKRLRKSWNAIEANGRASTSERTRNEIEEFKVDIDTRIRRISGQLVKKTFKFDKARGIEVTKKGGTKIRPLVISPIASRVVQRSLLEILSEHKDLKIYFKNPNSFGGLRKEVKGELSAVPLAIHEVISSINNGAKFVVCADIRSFFTKIPKPTVIKTITDVICDELFSKILTDAIAVELENMSRLRDKNLFPIGEIGVAQGNCLSPMLGNILLHDFDKKMNEGDCRCLRYVDDFIILAPTAAAAKARLRRAIAILGKFNMELAEEKTHAEPLSVTKTFEFLGIEFTPGLLKPVKSSQDRVVESAKKILEESKDFFQPSARERKIPSNQSLLRTLLRLDGLLRGWRKHYWFCNDNLTFANIDEKVDSLLATYFSAYRDARKHPNSNKREILGISSLSNFEDDRTPFEYNVT